MQLYNKYENKNKITIDFYIINAYFFVTIEKSGKSKIVSLSDDGKNALKFLNS